MTRSASRIGPRLERMIRQLDDEGLPYAEVWRRVGAAARAKGIPQPSYEAVRHAVRLVRAERRRPSTASVSVDVALRVKPIDALLDHLAGI